MKVIHIESGLGNQMLSYCEYLALRKMNPEEDFYIETMIYDIPECNDVICQWNGYELERIFGIKEPKNIKTLFSKEQWEAIINEVRASEFWHKNWNYPVYITNALNHAGLALTNIRGNFEVGYKYAMTDEKKKDTLWRRFVASKFGSAIKRHYYRLRKSKYVGRNDNRNRLFLKTDKNIFTGQWLSFKMAGNDRHLIDQEIRDTFVFPPFTDTRNQEMAKILSVGNSVAIHARRGDMLSGIAWMYKTGYFRRAVKYIRKHVDNPVFVFFTNTGSIEWCKENADTFGLDYKKDKVYFVDWNKDENSYRDMQLMSYCKHAIITKSSFGWWGAYFIKNKDKITISPTIEMDTTYHC